MKKTIKIGSRESRLAVIQAEIVMTEIKKHHPELRLELVTMSSKGDKDLSKPLDSFGRGDIFTNQLDYALATGKIDIAVHSLKDLPISDNPMLPIVAFSPREDPFDSLVLNGNKEDKNKAVGCSCQRRQLQFKAIYPDWETENIRGTVPARIQQLEDGKFGGLILAVAGLKRLGLEKLVSRRFTLEEMIPSACQGILAVQGRAGEDYYYLEKFNCKNAQIAAEGEREFVRTINDESAYNNGIYIEVQGDRVKLTGMCITPQKKIIRGEATGDSSQVVSLARNLGTTLKKGEGNVGESDTSWGRTGGQPAPNPKGQGSAPKC